MRISDWSSDVCSSDLRARLAAVGELLFDLLAARGLAVDIALDVSAPQLADPREFVLQFDALGGGLHAQRLGERDDRLDVCGVAVAGDRRAAHSSEEHKSELPSLMRRSSAVYCLHKTKSTR